MALPATRPAVTVRQRGRRLRQAIWTSARIQCSCDGDTVPRIVHGTVCRTSGGYSHALERGLHGNTGAGRSCHSPLLRFVLVACRQVLPLLLLAPLDLVRGRCHRAVRFHAPAAPPDTVHRVRCAHHAHWEQPIAPTLNNSTAHDVRDVNGQQRAALRERDRRHNRS